MSWTDQELSDMAKAAQAEQKFVYQDAFWAEAEAMLPAKKKAGFPFFVLGLIPLLGTLAYLGTAPLNTFSVEQAAKRMELNTTELMALQVNKSANEGINTNTKSNFDKPSSLAENPMNAVVSRSTDLAFSTKKEKAPVQPEVIPPKNSIVSMEKTHLPKVEELSTKNAQTFVPSTPLISNTSLNANEPQMSSDQSILATRSPKLLDTERWMSIDALQPKTLHAFSFEQSVPTLSIRPNKNRKYWNAYLEGGFAMGQSYMPSQVGHTTAISFNGGARYNFSGYFLQLGLGGEFQKANLEVNEREKIYHTSSTLVERDFSYRQLYRIEAPITLGYQLKNHIFQLSVVPAFLTGAKMLYAQRENGIMTDNGTSYANKEGWRTFSTSFGAGYGYQIFKSVSIGANLKWQLLNQINKNMVSEGNVRPFSGQVFIRKTIR